MGLSRVTGLSADRINYAPMGYCVNGVSEINLEVIPMDQGIRGSGGAMG